MKLEILILIIFPIAFVGMWLLITLVLSRLGWHKLVRSFPNEAPPKEGTIISGIGGRFSVVNYNGTLEMYPSSEGFHLQPIKLFKAFHPTVFIPWTAVSKVEKLKLIFIDYYILSIGNDRKFGTIRIKSSQFSLIRNYLNR